MKFYTALDGNDSWSTTWDLYEDQDSASKSAILQGLLPAQMTFSECSEDDTSTTQDDCLQIMNLTNKGLVGTIPEGFNDLTFIKSVILKDNEIKGFADGTFKDNQHLAEIDLSLNKIKQFSGLFPSSLTSLDLANNSISMDVSTVLNTLSKATEIEKLNLVGNKLFGSITADEVNIINTETLKWMNLADNQIKGELYNLKIKSTWTYLDISYNMFSGNFPNEFKNNEKINRKCNMFNCER